MILGLREGVGKMILPEINKVKRTPPKRAQTTMNVTVENMDAPRRSLNEIVEDECTLSDDDDDNNVIYKTDDKRKENEKKFSSAKNLF